MLNNKNCSRRSTHSKNSHHTNSPVRCYMEQILDNMPLAMAYIPYQQWCNIYEPNEAFKRGTIFEELDLPFTCAKECK